MRPSRITGAVNAPFLSHQKIRAVGAQFSEKKKKKNSGLSLSQTLAQL